MTSGSPYVPVNRHFTISCGDNMIKTPEHLYFDLKTPSLHGNTSDVGARDVNLKMSRGLNAQDIRTERKNYFVLLDEELLNGYT